MYKPQKVKLYSEEFKWEIFSNRENYKIVRAKVDLPPKYDKYYITYKDKILQDKYANDIKEPDVSDVYTNGYLYISISNEKSEWDKDYVPTNKKILEVLQRLNYNMYYQQLDIIK